VADTGSRRTTRYKKDEGLREWPRLGRVADWPVRAFELAASIKTGRPSVPTSPDQENYIKQYDSKIIRIPPAAPIIFPYGSKLFVFSRYLAFITEFCSPFFLKHIGLHSHKLARAVGGTDLQNRGIDAAKGQLLDRAGGDEANTFQKIDKN
jgi:hypothetical protein